MEGTSNKSWNEDIVFEVSVEKNIVVAMMVDETTTWKGTLAGLKELIENSMRK